MARLRIASLLAALWWIAAAAVAGPTAYVPNENSGTVSVIDTASDKVTGELHTGGKPRGKSLPAPHADRLTAERLDGAGPRIDGGDRVELGHLLLGEPKRAIVIAQVVDKGDTHQTALAPLLAPTVPSGSV